MKILVFILFCISCPHLFAGALVDELKFLEEAFTENSSKKIEETQIKQKNVIAEAPISRKSSAIKKPQAIQNEEVIANRLIQEIESDSVQEKIETKPLPRFFFPPKKKSYRRSR